MKKLKKLSLSELKIQMLGLSTSESENLVGGVTIFREFYENGNLICVMDTSGGSYTFTGTTETSQANMFAAVEADTWTGGNVTGMGYVPAPAECIACTYKNPVDIQLVVNSANANNATNTIGPSAEMMWGAANVGPWRVIMAATGFAICVYFGFVIESTGTPHGPDLGIDIGIEQ